MKVKKEHTIYDIAERLNLSPSTVSRALKDNPAISKKTRERINALAKELGYRTNTFARNLKIQKTNNIGVIVPKIDSSFISSAIGGIERIATESGYNLIISQSLESYEKEKTSAHDMFNNRVDGLLVSLAEKTVNTEHFKPFVERDIPILFFDRVDDELDCGKYTIDNYKASFDAVNHMIEQGCKNIIHITGNTNSKVYADRLKGYQEALNKNNLVFIEKNVIIGDLSLDSGINIAEEILKMQVLPDGVFVANDKCAVGCMLTLKRKGIKIPKDISFVGFNNDPISTLVDPNLSTVNYPGPKMGEMVARNLINFLQKKKNSDLKKNFIIDSELIIRESSLRYT